MFADVQILICLRGFYLGCFVFVPHQSRLSINYIRLLADAFDRALLSFLSIELNKESYYYYYGRFCLLLCLSLLHQLADFKS